MREKNNRAKGDRPAVVQGGLPRVRFYQATFDCLCSVNVENLRKFFVDC
jgi:hypothetical protein